jgi:hypothetical protein
LRARVYASVLARPSVSSIIVLLVATLIVVLTQQAFGAGGGSTPFWDPWFINLGGASPLPQPPFLEMSGALKPGTTLSANCWGLDDPDGAWLVMGNTLEFQPGPGGAYIVTFPKFVLTLDVHTYDDDGPGGKPPYSVVNTAIPFGQGKLPGPGMVFQVWAKKGPYWIASNAVGASFTVAAGS